MLANASKAPASSAPEKSMPLAARWSDDLDSTLASGTPETGSHRLSTGFESPPDPLKDQVPMHRRSPTAEPHRATTTK